MEFTPTEIRTYYRDRLPGLKQTSGRQWRGPCPVHNGKNLNFAVNAETGHAYCHSACGKGWDILGLEMDLTGQGFVEAKKAVWALLGRPEMPKGEEDVLAVYDYTSADGTLVYQVLRCVGKKFKQRRPDGYGRWVYSISGIQRLPYRLPNLAKFEDVFIVEGEKDVHTIERFGFAATCNSGGAGNFEPQLAQWFVGKRVYIVPDNDEKGRDHAMKVAELLADNAAWIGIVQLPNLPDKGDVSDFAARGGTAEQFVQHCEKAVEWTPDFRFKVESPEDKYVRTFVDTITECGGVDAFWDFRRQEGLPTPFPRLSRVLGGGLRPSEVYVIGGNQGSGKTSLALQFMLTALQKKRGVLMFSMEMDHRSVYQRLCGILAGVDLSEFREAQRAGSPDYPPMRQALAAAGAELAELPLLVSTKPSVTPEFIIAESARIAARQAIDAVVVDHMQLMGTTGTVRGDYEKFTAISRAMKHTAMELKKPLLVVSQTTRSNAADKRTELEVSDLRGSGAIEEDACAVMLLYPDAKDKEQTIANNTFARGPVKNWLKIGKNRYGIAGAYLPLAHMKTITTFHEWGEEGQ